MTPSSPSPDPNHPDYPEFFEDKLYLGEYQSIITLIQTCLRTCHFIIIIVRACHPAALWRHPEAGDWGPCVIWQLHPGPGAGWQRGRGHPRWGHARRLQTLPREIRPQKQKKTQCRVEGHNYLMKPSLWCFPRPFFYWLVKCKSLFEIKYYIRGSFCVRFYGTLSFSLKVKSYFQNGYCWISLHICGYWRWCPA